MQDNNGKVILSLVVGATAGIVAGLLLAPETGEETRTGLKKSATKWTDDLGKLLKDTLSNLNLPKTSADAPDAPASTHESRNAADDVLSAMSKESGAPATGEADHDGSSNDAGQSGPERTL